MITKTALKRHLITAYLHARDRRRSLDAWLVRHLCRYFSDEIESHLKNIATYGCSSGCISELIYNTDIIRFYAKYEPFIWQVVTDHLQSTGYTFAKFLAYSKLKVEDETDLKIVLSWFAVECLAYRFLEQFNSAL